MELMIVVVIIVILLLLVMMNLKTQLMRARDARRKADLNRLQKVYEEYFNDKQCYPFIEALENCGSGDLEPYIKKIPCDPISKDPYLYVYGSPSLCTGYRVCAKLEDKTDPDIARVGCDADGCGFAPGYNYCLSTGLPSYAPGFTPGSGMGWTPTPTPTPSYAGDYACTPGGQCNSYDNPAWHGCPVAFAESDCQEVCGNPANRCAD